MVSNTFFTVAKPYWDGLTDEERAAIETAAGVAKTFNDAEVLAAEAEAVAFLESQGVTVTTPDVAAFRNQVQQKFVESDFASTWPAGMLDRINAAGN
jgi:TRAP-type C4-dicarboxylate transport system substrate-binding protein